MYIVFKREKKSNPHATIFSESNSTVEWRVKYFYYAGGEANQRGKLGGTGTEDFSTCLALASQCLLAQEDGE